MKKSFDMRKKKSINKNFFTYALIIIILILIALVYYILTQKRFLTSPDVINEMVKKLNENSNKKIN
jgi:hypothetical protein